MPIDTISSFNLEAFNQWQEGEDRLEKSWSDQVTIRCLKIFDTKIRAINKSVPQKEAWNRKYGFALQNLYSLDQNKAYIVTPYGLCLQDKTALLDMMDSSEIWFYLIKALNTMNNTLAIISETNLRIPKDCFLVNIITLEAQDGKRYLVRERQYEIHSYGGKHVKGRDRWHDIDLGRFEP